MRHVTASIAHRDFEGILETVIEQGELFSVATDKGAVIIISQNEWNSMLETNYLYSIPGMVESIVAAKNAPASERLEDIGWDIN